jgi:aldehyde dehydrogenase (NAD+)
VFAAAALGNTVVAVPSPVHPLVATDLDAVLDTADVPRGVIHAIPGDRDALAAVLAAHDAVAAVWYFGTGEGGAAVERASCGNLKRTWVEGQAQRAWDDPRQGASAEILRQAARVKTVWMPYGA